MEVLVQIVDLVQVFGLDLNASGAHRARLFVFVLHQQLIDDDVVRVDAAFGQLLDQSFGFVERQEFGDADADECGLFLEKMVFVYNLYYNRLQYFYFFRQLHFFYDRIFTTGKYFSIIFIIYKIKVLFNNKLYTYR